MFPLYTPASTWRPFVIRERGDVLHFGPDPTARRVALLLGVGGTAVIGWLFLVAFLASDVNDARHGVRRALAVAAYCAAVVVGGVVGWNCTGGRSADVIFDRCGGVFRGRCWTGRGWRPDCAGTLDSIASLQVCCHEIEVEEGDNYQTYEVNVVLASPPGARLGLGSHADAGEIQRDAKRLAEFLQCGILMDCPLLRPFPPLPETMRHRKGKRS